MKILKEGKKNPKGINSQMQSNKRPARQLILVRQLPSSWDSKRQAYIHNKTGRRQWKINMKTLIKAQRTLPFKCQELGRKAKFSKWTRKEDIPKQRKKIIE